MEPRGGDHSVRSELPVGGTAGDASRGVGWRVGWPAPREVYALALPVISEASIHQSKRDRRLMEENPAKSILGALFGSVRK